MISLYYNENLKAGVVMQDGMPMLVITDETVLDFELYVEEAIKQRRQVGKSNTQHLLLDAFLRCPDESLGWKRL